MVGHRRAVRAIGDGQEFLLAGSEHFGHAPDEVLGLVADSLASFLDLVLRALVLRDGSSEIQRFATFRGFRLAHQQDDSEIGDN